jgi:hypothetical protein
LASHAETRDVRETLTLRCGECGERLMLLGREGGWYEVPARTFECGGCGHELSLGSRIVPGSQTGERSSTSPLPDGPG